MTYSSIAEKCVSISRSVVAVAADLSESIAWHFKRFSAYLRLRTLKRTRQAVALGLAVLVVLAAGSMIGRVGTKYLDTRIGKAVERTLSSRMDNATQGGQLVTFKPAQAGGQLTSNTNLELRLERLERELLGGTAGGADRLPLAADYRGHVSNVLAMLDAVGPYRKNGLFEVYGGSLRERRTGPIRVSEASFEITHDEAWLIWSPDYSPARDATHLAIEFAALPILGKVTVGFTFDDGQAFAFIVDLGTYAPAPKGLPAPLLPADLAARAGAAQQFVLPKLTANRIIAEIPPSMMLALRSAGKSSQIAEWFVKVNGAAGTGMRFKSVALIRPAAPQTSSGVTLSGQVVPMELPPGMELELLTETGTRTRQVLSSDGNFSFTGIDATAIVSLRLMHPILEHYSNLGRWFVAAHSRTNITIDRTPRYINTDGHAPDQSKARFVGPRSPSSVSALYEPHARQYWPGGSSVQEYDSTTFTNNHGYLDRDRFFDNPDNCVRLASTGGSDMVALQVRPQEKFNILLEESLGIALSKCVEVISAGADNGDLGTNYPRIRDYTSKFKVNHTLVSMASGLVYQVNPQMLRDGLGMDPENSALPNFYFDKTGALAFRVASPAYPVFMTKPTHPEYVKGIPFSYTLSVPGEVMPSQGKEAFRYWTEIVNYIERFHPGQNFIFHTGIDQAQCRSNCEVMLQLDATKAVAAGAKTYVANLIDYCATNRYKCVNLPFSREFGEKPNLLTFEFDSHYSPLGHQWLARELTSQLLDIVKN